MPTARVYRVLDTKAMSDELLAYLEKHEGSSKVIDADLARDWAWTDEIMSVTKHYLVTDSDGNSLAKAKSDAEAHRIAASAKVTLTVDVDADPVEDEPEIDLSEPDDEAEDALPAS